MNVFSRTPQHIAKVFFHEQFPIYDTLDIARARIFNRSICTYTLWDCYYQEYMYSCYYYEFHNSQLITCITVYMVYLVGILICWFGKSHKDCHINFMLLLRDLYCKHELLYKQLKSANLKSHQYHYLSKLPNI